MLSLKDERFCCLSRVLLNQSILSFLTTAVVRIVHCKEFWWHMTRGKTSIEVVVRVETLEPGLDIQD